MRRRRRKLRRKLEKKKKILFGRTEEVFLRFFMRELPAQNLPIEMVATTPDVLHAFLKDLGVTEAPTFAPSVRGQAVLYIVQTWNASGFSG